MLRATAFVVVMGMMLGAGIVHAEVMDASQRGFTSRNTASIAAPAERVYRVLVENVGEWWDPAHTFSGDSRALTIEARPGGCFCEELGDKGGVQHLEVIFVEPAKQLRMRGGLGPLQGMGVAGSLTWALNETGESTEITLSYSVGGYYPEGLNGLADPVDRVLHGQLERLKSFIEKGVRGSEKR